MENALWNGELVIATEIAKNYDVEKKVRNASREKELRCQDNNCEDPLLKYCHGDKKSAYFAHLNNVNCDYSEFDKSDTQRMKNIRIRMYEHFISKGYKVKPEIKLLPHHYSHLVFELGDQKIAVELGTKRTSVGQVEKLNEEYKSAEIGVNWIVVDDTDKYVIEDQTFFLNRYALNESQSKSLVVINEDGNKVAQYKCDNTDYKFENITLIPEDFGDTYKEEAKIDGLVFDGDEISILGFEERYSEWLDIKREVFCKEVERITEKRKLDKEKKKAFEEQQRIRQEEQQSFKRENQERVRSIKLEVNIESEYQKLKEEILPLLDQKDKPARDSKGNRWVECRKCGLIAMEKEFTIYGGGGDETNSGECKRCSGRGGQN